MTIFSIFVTNLLSSYRSTLLVHKLLSDYKGNIIKLILKEELGKISFY